MTLLCKVKRSFYAHWSKKLLKLKKYNSFRKFSVSLRDHCFLQQGEFSLPRTHICSNSRIPTVHFQFFVDNLSPAQQQSKRNKEELIQNVPVEIGAKICWISQRIFCTTQTHYQSAIRPPSWNRRERDSGHAPRRDLLEKILIAGS